VIDKEKIISIYKQFEIPHWIEGKNVTRGWVNIRCPFCNDSSNHCGIDPKTEKFSCWICGKSGSFIDLLIKLTGLSYNECKAIISSGFTSFQESTTDFLRKVFSKNESGSAIVTKEQVNLPKEFELVTYDTKFPLLDSYLRRRNVLIDTVVEYNCGICRSGKYMNRLIIPVIYKGEIVSFQAADLTGFARIKYIGAPKPYEVNNYLYNYDQIERRMIVVEGILDTWRVGEEAVAAFTCALTENQKRLILEKDLEELYICFDGEGIAYFKSRKEANDFSTIPIVETINLPLGEDPDSLGKEKIYKLIEARKV